MVFKHSFLSQKVEDSETRSVDFISRNMNSETDASRRYDFQFYVSSVFQAGKSQILKTLSKLLVFNLGMEVSSKIAMAFTITIATVRTPGLLSKID